MPELFVILNVCPWKVGDVAVPVNTGDEIGANAANAVAVAVDIGFAASDVLLQLPKPTIAAVIPLTVPVNVGDAIGAKAGTPVITDHAHDDAGYEVGAPVITLHAHDEAGKLVGSVAHVLSPLQYCEVVPVAIAGSLFVKAV